MSSPGSANYEVIYGVSLLDDVHNYFPSLLYDTGRFQNLPQVFHYVRHQMNTRFNLFSYGAQRHAQQQQPQQQQQQQRADPIPRPMSSTQNPSTPRTEAPRGDIIYTSQPLRQSTLTSANILMALLGLGGTNDAWNSFNTPVIVSPSAETISLNTHILNGVTNVTCAICQDSIVSTDTCRRLNPCQHTYHQVCIDQWFQRSVACPTCRHDIRDPTPISPQLTAISAADLINNITAGAEAEEEDDDDTELRL